MIRPAVPSSDHSAIAADPWTEGQSAHECAEPRLQLPAGSCHDAAVPGHGSHRAALLPMRAREGSPFVQDRQSSEWRALLHQSAEPNCRRSHQAQHHSQADEGRRPSWCQAMCCRRLVRSEWALALLRPPAQRQQRVHLRDPTTEETHLTRQPLPHRCLPRPRAKRRSDRGSDGR